MSASADNPLHGWKLECLYLTPNMCFAVPASAQPSTQRNASVVSTEEGSTKMETGILWMNLSAFIAAMEIGFIT